MKDTSILSILSSFRHLFEDTAYHPNILLTDLKTLPFSTKKVYPCEIIDLRSILSEEIIEGDKYVPLFSINFSDKYLKKYPIFLLIDTHTESSDKGLDLQESPLDIKNILLSVIVNEPVDKIVEERVRRIMEESEIKV